MFALKKCFFLVLPAMLATLSACATGPSTNQMHSQVLSQGQEQLRQQKRLTQIEETLARTQPTQADNWAEMSNVRNQVAVLSGQMEELRNARGLSSPDGATTLESLNEKFQELGRKIDFMAAQLGVVFDEMPASSKASVAPTASTAPATATPSGTPGAPSETANATTQNDSAEAVEPAVQGQTPAADTEEAALATSNGGDLYQQALEQFYARKYGLAQKMWSEFVKGFPTDSLVPNAIFWQGECFFQLRDYANAVLTYQKVIEKHTSSIKYKSALLKQGIAFFKLQKKQAGSLVLNDLIKKYPDSAEAKRAQAYLKSEK